MGNAPANLPEFVENCSKRQEGSGGLGGAISTQKAPGWLCAFAVPLHLALVLSSSLSRSSRGSNCRDRTYDDQLDSRYPTSSRTPRSTTWPATDKRVQGGGEPRTSRGRLGEYLPQLSLPWRTALLRALREDFAGIGRAAWEDLQTLTVSQGGSTITEQLMKNLYISEGATGQRLALAPPGAGRPRFRL